MEERKERGEERRTGTGGKPTVSYRCRLVLQAVPGPDVDYGDSSGEICAEQALLLWLW